jgi:hypothetical protein
MAQTEHADSMFEIEIGNPTGRSDDSFAQLFLNAVDCAFSLLGDSGKAAFYKYLEDAFGVARSQIPDSADVFAQALEDIFGQTARLIEVRIMRSLHEAVPEFEFSGDETFSFVNYVEKLRFFL